MLSLASLLAVTLLPPALAHVALLATPCGADSAGITVSPGALSTLKDFQGILGALLALTGVTASLLFNAAKERRAQATTARAAARALSTALEQELRLLDSALNDLLEALRLEFTPLAQEFRFSVSRQHDTLYKANLTHLGILSAGIVQAVVAAYLAYNNLVPQLYATANDNPIAMTQLDTVTLVALRMRAGESNIASAVAAVLPAFEYTKAAVGAALPALNLSNREDR